APGRATGRGRAGLPAEGRDATLGDHRAPPPVPRRPPCASPLAVIPVCSWQGSGKPVAGRVLGSAEAAVARSSSGSPGFDTPLRSVSHPAAPPSLRAEGPRNPVAGRVLGSAEAAVARSSSGSPGFDKPLRALPHSEDPPSLRAEGPRNPVAGRVLG